VISPRLRVVAVSVVAALGVAAVPGVAVAALPAVSVPVLTLPMTDSSTSHTGLTGTASCAPGSTLVGGGSFLRRVANEPSGTNSSLNATQGLVLGGQAPSQGVADSKTSPPPAGATPYDLAVTDGTTDPSHWFTDSNFTGVAEAGDQFATFGMCATSGGPAHTIVKTASTVGANATQVTSPPNLTVATCPSGDTLIGGGAITTTPDQFNDGVTTGNNGNLKPMASYPSNSSGVAAANGSTTANSWSAYGLAGIASSTDTVEAYALCSTDSTTPPVQVARTDVQAVGPQAGGLVDFAAATCPSGTQMIGGGYDVDEQTASGSGFEPQQGWHMIGSFPSTDPTGLTEVANGATNPETWSTELNSGGVGISSGQDMNQHAFAMCATVVTPPPGEITGTVTNGSGAPLSNVCVYLYASGATGARTGDTGTCTNSSGQYVMNVASPGSYNVAFYDPSGTFPTQWYNGAASEAAATPVTVTSGAVTSAIDATMSGPTQITGTVTSTSGAPLSNVCVYLYASGGTGARTGDTGVCTNSAGQYAMNVATAGSYNVAFYDPSGTFPTQWYNGAASEAAATLVTVSSGAVTSGIDATMSGPTQITGTVTSGSGAPLSNVCVYLYASGATGARTGDTGTCTNSSGQYVMNVASPGSYNVAFYDPSGTFPTQWYNGAASEAAATPVTVSSGAVTSAINATMSGPTQITGTVTSTSGAPLANICVYLYASGATGARTGDTGVCTNSAGQYAMNVATAGAYNVVFYDPAGTYLTQWYNGAATEGTATPVTVASATQTVNVNATMQL
jgi:protocatechuate 3,4-dioxygenase beta subunit